MNTHIPPTYDRPHRASPLGGPGGLSTRGRLGLNFTCINVLKGEGCGSFLSLQVSEMSEIISLRVGVKFATSLNTGEDLPHESYGIAYRNARVILDVRTLYMY